MRAVLQRVRSAEVSVERKKISSIQKGLLVLLGVEKRDADSDVEYIVDKIVHLRIFEDDEEKMNDSILDIQGEILLVSQFTLLGDARKGRRPSFSDSAGWQEAKRLYELVRKKLEVAGCAVLTGEFGADMDVALVNQGPVTILLDSKKMF